MKGLVPVPVEHADHFLKLLLGQPRVERGGLDVGVTQVLLDSPQVAAGPAQELDAARMAEGVRMKL